MSTSTNRNILAIGLPIPPQFGDSEKIFAQQIAAAAEQDLHLDMFLTDMVGVPVADIIGRLGEKLRSKQYALICIGFGVRGNQELTEVFEAAVNVCVEVQGNGVRFGFQTRPDGLVETWKRVMGERA